MTVDLYEIHKRTTTTTGRDYNDNRDPLLRGGF